MKVTCTTFRTIRWCVIAYIEFVQSLPRLRESKPIFLNMKKAHMLSQVLNNFVYLCHSSYSEEESLMGRPGVVSGRENNQERKRVGNDRGGDREGRGTSLAPSSGRWTRNHQKEHLLEV